MILEYSLRARADIANIFAYIESRSPGSAAGVVRSIVRRTEALREFPETGVATGMHGVRRLTVPNRPYLVCCRVDGETTSILHIRPAARRPWRGQD